MNYLHRNEYRKFLIESVSFFNRAALFYWKDRIQMDQPLWHESIPRPMKLNKSKVDQVFEGIFHENWNAIHRLLARMVVDPAEAEDLALETFFRLYNYRPAKYEAFNTRAWLYKVATNLALQSIRSFKRREHYEVHAGKDALIEAQDDQPHKL